MSRAGTWRACNPFCWQRGGADVPRLPGPARTIAICSGPQVARPLDALPCRIAQRTCRCLSFRLLLRGWGSSRTRPLRPSGVRPFLSAWTGSLISAWLRAGMMQRRAVLLPTCRRYSSKLRSGCWRTARTAGSRLWVTPSKGSCSAGELEHPHSPGSFPSLQELASKRAVRRSLGAASAAPKF